MKDDGGDKPEESEEIYVDEEVLNLLRESLKTKLKDDIKKPSKVRINSALKSTIAEFLTCFKLIGFDLDGNPINMTITNNKMEQNAIENAFMQHFGEFIQVRNRD
jgi:hypothetical protein